MGRFICFFILLAAGPAWTQQTVYVAPVPGPSDPNYISYQLGQLAEILRRNQMQAAQLEMLEAQADLARSATAKAIDREELEGLLGLAKLLDAAGTAEQKAALQRVIQEKLDAVLPATVRNYPPGTVLVYSTPGFPWAAEQAAEVLAGRPVAVEAGFAEVREIAAANPNVTGILEIEVSVYKAYETVKANCYRRDGTVAWTKKTLFNAGGSPDRLARSMVGRLLGKIKGQKCPS